MKVVEKDARVENRPPWVSELEWSRFEQISHIKDLHCHIGARAEWKLNPEEQHQHIGLLDKDEDSLEHQNKGPSQFLPLGLHLLEIHKYVPKQEYGTGNASEAKVAGCFHEALSFFQVDNRAGIDLCHEYVAAEESEGKEGHDECMKDHYHSIIARTALTWAIKHLQVIIVDLNILFIQRFAWCSENACQGDDARFAEASFALMFIY